MRQPPRPTTKVTYVLLACQAPLPHAEPVAAVAGPFVVVVARASLSVASPRGVASGRPEGMPGRSPPPPLPGAARGAGSPPRARPTRIPGGAPTPAPPPREEATGAGAGRIAAPSLVSPAILGVSAGDRADQLDVFGGPLGVRHGSDGFGPPRAIARPSRRPGRQGPGRGLPQAVAWGLRTSGADALEGRRPRW